MTNLKKIHLLLILVSSLTVGTPVFAEVFLYKNTHTNTSFYGSYKFDDVSNKVFDVNVFFGHDSFPGITTFSDEKFNNIGTVEKHENGYRIIFKDDEGSLTGTAESIGNPSNTEVTYKTHLRNFNAGIERSLPSNNGGTFTRTLVD
jgi:hypothetical protein